MVSPAPTSPARFKACSPATHRLGCGALLLVGHRGYPRRYPENTLASLLAALLYGADGVEFDVWRTGDGRLVVVHDRTLSRVAGVDVDVKRASYREIAGYSLGMGQHVPLLEDVLEGLPRGRLLMVEVKDPDATVDVYDMLRGKGWLEDTVILSFHATVLEKLRSLDGRVRLGFNVESVEAAQLAPKLHEKLNLEIVNLPAEALNVVGFERVTEYMAMLRRLGLKVGMWSLNSLETARRLAGLVDVVITDDVEAMLPVKQL